MTVESRGGGTAQGEVQVRNVRTEQESNLAETVIDLGGDIVRFGFSLITLPFSIIPTEPRQHLRNATRELLYAVASAPGEVADVAGEVVKDWARDTGAEVPEHHAPHDEMSSASAGGTKK